MKISENQYQIIENSHTEKIIKVNALAGTGKTSTLILVAEENPEDRILYMVLNKANQLEAVQRFPSNVIPKTVHSLAYQAVMKYTNVNLRNTEFYSYKDIADMYNIDYNKAFLVYKEFNDFCNNDDLEFENDRSIAKKLFDDMRSCKINPTYSFYLKLFHLLLTEQEIENNFTMAMIDESQDTNLVSLAIFNLLDIKKKIYVGDENQRIYSFRGSKNIFNYVEGKDLYLTETYRSNQKIVDIANIVLKRYKNYPVKMTTNVKETKKVNNKAFISRTNSKLIGIMDKLINEDKKFKTIREPKEIFSLVTELYYLKNNEKYKIKTFNYLKKFKNMKEIEDYANETDSSELITAIKILEEYDKKIFDIKAVADKYFYDKELQVKIFLTTAHTSKGLEWDEVELIKDFKTISDIVLKSKKKTIEEFIKDIDKIDISKPELIDEINLMYVAITRAKQKIFIPSKLKVELYLSDKEINKIIKEKRKKQKEKKKRKKK